MRRLEDPFAVADYALRELQVELRLSTADVDRIPAQGAVRKTEPRVLRKYMSDSAWARFQQKHRARAPRSDNDGRAA